MATKPRPAAATKSVAKTSTKAAAKKAPAKAAARKAPAAKADTGEVLKELRSLAKELNKAAKGLESRKGRKGEPKEISTVLGNVERMTAEAATKSLMEAESAKISVDILLESLGRDWSRKGIETALQGISGHLTNIMVAQEFQDLAGQSIRQAVKALVGAIIVVEGGGPTEERRLSQSEVDGLMKDLMS